tara:strand:+ start:225 stop:425 length:201 start_codon:yes stop_codon:yes gene_type:complete
VSKKLEKRIMRFRYRISGQQSQEVIATYKICKQKAKKLKEQHGDDIKISKIVDADFRQNPCGAPHV